MREVLNLNFKWAFRKKGEILSAMPDTWDWVNIPHSYNAIDGQDGNNDLYRGKAVYMKELFKSDIPEAEKYFLEINGANSSADLYVNGKHMKHHDGGYSTWRVDITDELQASNIIAIEVDNAPNDFCYPQNADFTFYGGVYRDVNLICVPKSHFDLEYFGTHGLKVTPELKDGKWMVAVESYTTGAAEGQKLVTTIRKPCGCLVGTVTQDAAETTACIEIAQPRLWNGKKDPYLYTAEVCFMDGDTVLDCVSAKFGLRTFEIDPEKGFILNGEAYPLRGVSRHQDRWALGNALTHKEHEEDIALILEGGFNTIRLAHYQHDQYFYDLCDAAGLVIWAEIPYITSHMPGGRANTISQFTELIVQNYNHPCIVVWGLSNEINSGNYSPEVHADLLENHNILNDMAHKMDPTRLTTMAIVSACPIEDPYIQIPDTVSWNHYFGWYGGTVEEYAPWFDNFHAKYPNIPVGMSEYGCEAPLNWHSSTPEAGDYSEEYQAYYHEECIKQLFPRQYIWATHVWNMFDFGADARNEGGENGQNHKGLIDFKRQYKKDAFYAYKAWLSEDPFVHLAGKRYINRAEDVTKVTVYSNQPEVELIVNGTSLGKKTAGDHFFKFDVTLADGVNNLVAVAGDLTDSSKIIKVAEKDESYIMKEKGAVLNWWDIVEIEGKASLNTKLSVFGTFENGVAQLEEALGGVIPTDKLPIAYCVEAIGNFSVLKILMLLGMSIGSLTKEQLMTINEALNKISIC